MLDGFVTEELDTLNIPQTVVDAFTNMNLIDSFTRSLEISAFDAGTGIGPYTEELSKWEAALVCLVDEEGNLENLSDLEEYLADCCNGSSAAREAFELVERIHRGIHKLDITGRLFKVYRIILEKNGYPGYKSFSKLGRKLNEVQTKVAVREIAKKLNACLDGKLDIDALCDFLTGSVGRSANSEEGIVSSDSAIAKVGTRLTSGRQFCNILVAACNATDRPKEAFDYLRSKTVQPKIIAAITKTIEAGNLNSEKDEFSYLKYIATKLNLEK